ncbi:MAG: 4Fe-4S binding protein [Bacteriovoracaceae bacterium]|nr:4Fe-4S binding protein [Bacteriovoracaceae bacterium]
MGHLTTKSAYTNLVDRINKFPQGAPPTKLLFSILQILFTKDEASFVALMPIKPFRVKDAAKLSKLSESECKLMLESLASRGLLLDIQKGDDYLYVLPPPMAGFFEFALMRVRKDIDQKLLSELFYQYIVKEDDFILNLLGSGETQMGRFFVNEKSLEGENTLHVLDFEKASEVIQSSSEMGVGLCYCRHSRDHLNLACETPQELCFTFGTTAKSLIRNKIARQIDKSEGMELLHQAYEHNLVQFGENVQNGVGFMCNCCSCCCEALTAVRKFSALVPIQDSGFIPKIDKSSCSGCGKCIRVCPVEAMSVVSSNDYRQVNKVVAKLDESLCIGCGVCVRNCKQIALSLQRSKKKIITPINSAHRYVLMAIERGKLQNLIFDKQALWNHRMMATILGVILKLPPAKQVMASKQFKSRYLQNLFLKKRAST